MVASDGPGEYVVAFEAHAGTAQQRLESGSVAYITTGLLLTCAALCCSVHAHVWYWHAIELHWQDPLYIEKSNRLKLMTWAVKHPAIKLLHHHNQLWSKLLSRACHGHREVVSAGGVVPDGADAVVQIENTDQLPEQKDGEKRTRINKVLMMDLCLPKAELHSITPGCVRTMMLMADTLCLARPPWRRERSALQQGLLAPLW